LVRGYSRHLAAYFSLSPAYPSTGEKGLREDVSRLYGTVYELKEQVENTDANSMLCVSLAKKAPQIEKLARTEQGSGPRLTEHLLCFHGKPRERQLGGREKFFCLFVTDFPLQAEENCVSLKRSKKKRNISGDNGEGT